MCCALHRRRHPGTLAAHHSRQRLQRSGARMKIVDIDHGEWTERRFIPDEEPPAGDGKANGQASNAPSNAGPASMPWPKLGPAAYYGLAGEVVTTLLPHTEADPAALLLQYLACFGNMAGRAPFIRVANAKHYPNIFVLIGG